MEYPSLNTSVLNYFRSWPDGPPAPNPIIKESAKQLILDEGQNCDRDTPLGDDGMIMDELFYSQVAEPSWGEMLKALYWRGRVQMAIFNIFYTLCMRGLLHPNCLRLPMTFYLTPRPVSALACLLGCYEGPHRESFLDPAPFRYHGNLFEGPLNWLATMILRGATDIGKCFETITACGFLGELNEEMLEEWKREHETSYFEINHYEMSHHSVGPAEFGLWLPHGLGNVDKETFARRLRGHWDRFDRIERVFRDYFQIPQDDI